MGDPREKGKVWGVSRSSYQLWSAPLVEKLGGIPFLVAFPVFPEVAAEVVDGEEKLLGRVLVQGAEDAVVADESLELAAQGVALDPIYTGRWQSAMRLLFRKTKRSGGGKADGLIINPPYDAPSATARDVSTYGIFSEM